MTEDVDVAGLKNRGSSIRTSVPSGNSQESPSTESVGLRQHQDEGHISLSGLLNVIDEIASNEGRILMLTTNSIKDLDPALIRPGRVDLSIESRLATKENFRHLLKLMFEATARMPGDQRREVRLEDAADQFANVVPLDTFSAAEIQGYLLTKKRSVDDALTNAEEWVQSMLAKRGL